MKQIKKSELKEGDWISTSQIYNPIQHATTIINELRGHQKVAEVIKIENNKITMRHWRMIEGDSYEEIMTRKGEVFLLEMEELLEIKKRLILNNL